MQQVYREHNISVIGLVRCICLRVHWCGREIGWCDEISQSYDGGGQSQIWTISDGPCKVCLSKSHVYCHTHAYSLLQCLRCDDAQVVGCWSVSI
jgi:hypothetical protein